MNWLELCVCCGLNTLLLSCGIQLCAQIARTITQGEQTLTILTREDRLYNQWSELLSVCCHAGENKKNSFTKYWHPQEDGIVLAHTIKYNHKITTQWRRYYLKRHTLYAKTPSHPAIMMARGIAQFYAKTLISGRPAVVIALQPPGLTETDYRDHPEKLPVSYRWQVNPPCERNG